MVHFSGQKHFCFFWLRKPLARLAGGAQVQANAMAMDVCLRSTLVLVCEYDEGGGLERVMLYIDVYAPSIINVLL